MVRRRFGERSWPFVTFRPQVPGAGGASLGDTMLSTTATRAQVYSPLLPDFLLAWESLPSLDPFLRVQGTVRAQACQGAAIYASLSSCCSSTEGTSAAGSG